MLPDGDRRLVRVREHATARSRRSSPDSPARRRRRAPARAHVPGLRERPLARLPPRPARHDPRRRRHLLDLARGHVRLAAAPRPRLLPRARHAPCSPRWCSPGSPPSASSTTCTTTPAAPLRRPERHGGCGARGGRRRRHPDHPARHALPARRPDATAAAARRASAASPTPPPTPGPTRLARSTPAARPHRHRRPLRAGRRPPTALADLARPRGDEPVHAHVSEQPAENAGRRRVRRHPARPARRRRPRRAALHRRARDPPHRRRRRASSRGTPPHLHLPDDRGGPRRRHRARPAARRPARRPCDRHRPARPDRPLRGAAAARGGSAARVRRSAVA